MCGIAGIVGGSIPEGAIERMTQAIAHRGPDASGYFREPGIHFGHRRLSIIDTSERGNQPMHGLSERYVLVHNGEIYNYQELRREIDYPWTSGSDTEVIIAAYHQWGPACLHRFAGMWAFAIWDRQEQRLFVARDRLGIKPLYLLQAHGQLHFASEIRALLASGIQKPTIDREALASFLMYQTVYGHGTILQGVEMLPPGCHATWHQGQLHVEQWWDIWEQASPEAKTMDRDSILRRVRALMEQSIQRRLVSDVPVGAFLSGGIDSSAVVALMARASAQPVDTFSIVFGEKEYDESKWSRIIAERYSTRHHEILLKPDDFLTALPQALAAMDHPSGDGINSYVVSKVTAERGVKVALSGLGGDELFGGYPIFGQLPAIQARKIMRLPLFLRELLAGAHGLLAHSRGARKKQALLRLPDTSTEEVYKVFRTIYDWEHVQLLGDSVQHPLGTILQAHAPSRKALPLLSQIGGLDILSYTQSVLLRDTDQMSMAHALEVREPFFDHELLAFVMGIPDAIKRPAYPKQLLVESMGDLLPHELVHRPKMGFVFPWELWLRGPLRDFAHDRFSAFAKRGFLSGQDLLDRVWPEFQTGRGPWLWTHVWLPVVLEDWMQRNGVSA